MKATVVTIILISMMVASAAWAGKFPGENSLSDSIEFKARVSDIHGDTLSFTILNPDLDQVVVKVFSDRNVLVMEYFLGKSKGMRVNYLMDSMRPCTYTAVVERNEEVVLRKDVELTR